MSRNFSKKNTNGECKREISAGGSSCSKILFQPKFAEVKSSSFQSKRSTLSGHIQRATALQKKPMTLSLKRSADAFPSNRVLDSRETTRLCDVTLTRPNKISRTNDVVKIGVRNDIVESSDRKILPVPQRNLKRKS